MFVNGILDVDATMPVNMIVQVSVTVDVQLNVDGMQT